MPTVSFSLCSIFKRHYSQNHKMFCFHVYGHVWNWLWRWTCGLHSNDAVACPLHAIVTNTEISSSATHCTNAINFTSWCNCCIHLVYYNLYNLLFTTIYFLTDDNNKWSTILTKDHIAESVLMGYHTWEQASHIWSSTICSVWSQWKSPIIRPPPHPRSPKPSCVSAKKHECNI